jgi:ABC-2 type transport system permease protein
MPSLLVVEARRFLARRTVRIAAVLIVAAIAVAGLVTYSVSRPPTPEVATRDRLARERAVQACIRGDFGIDAEDVPPGTTLEEFCEDVVGEGGSTFQFRMASLPSVYTGTAFPLFLLAWLVSASFVGAEWHHGTMATLLTWEPRRIRVIAAKAAVAVALATLGTLVLQILLAAALLPAAALRGSTEGMDRAWAAETAGVLLRGAGVCAIAAGIGFSIASIARNTAASLGLGFGYLIVFEQLLAGLRPGWQPWLLVTNIATFVTGDPEAIGPMSRSVAEAGLLLSAYAAALLLIAGVSFWRRDVT